MTHLNRRTFLATATATATATTFPMFAWADDAFPNKAIKVIVPIQAGGAADAGVRIVAAALSTKVKQPVIVDNKPGGSFAIGMQAIASSPPDGYTLIALNTGMVAAQATQQRFDLLKSVVPITKVGITPVLFVVPTGSKFGSIKEMVAYAKANPGKLNYGSVGIGTLEHLWVTLFSKAAGIEMTHVPFKGMPDAMTSLVRGDLDFVPAVYPQAYPFVEQGKLREFGVISDNRLKSRPDLPTIKEQGFNVPPFEFWSGYAAPAGTPPAIIEKLHRDLVAVLHEKRVVEKYSNLSTTIGTNDKPSDFAELIASDLEWMNATAVANKIKLG